MCMVECWWLIVHSGLLMFECACLIFDFDGSFIMVDSCCLNVHGWLLMVNCLCLVVDD